MVVEFGGQREVGLGVDVQHAVAVAVAAVEGWQSFHFEYVRVTQSPLAQHRFSPRHDGRTTRVVIFRQRLCGCATVLNWENPYGLFATFYFRLLRPDGFVLREPNR